jgi:hypothetical protein
MMIQRIFGGAFAKDENPSLEVLRGFSHPLNLAKMMGYASLVLRNKNMR